MKIIIAGTGEVGFHLSKLLAQEEHDIVIIDNTRWNFACKLSIEPSKSCRTLP